MPKRTLVLAWLLVLLAVPAWAQPPASAVPAPASTQAALTAVGGDTCATCHDTLAATFSRSAHGDLADHELRGQPGRCEACHGLGSRHVASGDPADIRAYSTLSVADASRTCLNCHRQGTAMEWASSAHAGADVACTACHRVHQSRQVVSAALQQVDGLRPVHTAAPAVRGSLVKAETELCLDCHREQRARLMLSSRHPVREGRMRCNSCHDPHGGQPGQAMLRTDERVNELCTSCHASKAGPFIFEHAPVEESCLTCHDPHGTTANNLLKQGEPFLCLQCHEMHFHAARLNPSTPFPIPSGVTVTNWSPTAFQQGYNTRCSACHSKVHGSDLPSQGVSGGGRALTR
ncbi:MAG: GSU2203 family decaheme c-type cytochrome [Acidobacteriota bacterium]